MSADRRERRTGRDPGVGQVEAVLADSVANGAPQNDRQREPRRGGLGHLALCIGFRPRERRQHVSSENDAIDRRSYA
jgi:hypothetical protein